MRYGHITIDFYQFFSFFTYLRLFKQLLSSYGFEQTQPAYHRIVFFHNKYQTRGWNKVIFASMRIHKHWYAIKNTIKLQLVYRWLYPQQLRYYSVHVIIIIILNITRLVSYVISYFNHLITIRYWMIKKRDRSVRALNSSWERKIYRNAIRIEFHGNCEITHSLR